MRNYLIFIASIIFLAQIAMLSGQAQSQFNPSHLDSLNKVLASNQRLNNKYGIAINTYDIGEIYRQRGESKKALDLFASSIALLEEIKNSSEVTQVYEEIKLVHKGLSKIPRELEYYDRPLLPDEQGGLAACLTNHLTFLGSIYYYIPDYPKAIEYFQKSLYESEQVGNKKEIALNLSNIGHIYFNRSDYTKALECFQKATNYNEILKDSISMAHNIRMLGTNYVYMSNYPKALEFFQKALLICEQANYKKGSIEVLYRMGYVYGDLSDYGEYGDLSDYTKALECFQKALAIGEQLGDENVLAGNYRNMGNAYSKLFDYAKALEYFQKSFDISEKFGYKNEMANTLFSIGSCYIELSNIPKAVEACDKALQLTEQSESKNAIAVGYNKMGNFFSRNADYSKAVEFYQKSADIYEQIGNEKDKVLNLSSMGQAYINIGRYAEAFEVCQEAYIISKQMGNKNAIAFNLNKLGHICQEAPVSVLQKLGIKPEQRFVRALDYQNQSLKIAQEIGSLALKRDAYQNLQLTYERQKDFSNAYAAYKKYIAVQDSINGEETKKHFLRKEIQYEFDKKESELKLQQQFTSEQLHKQLLLNRQQRLIYFLAGIAILGIAGLLAMRQWYARKKHQLEVDRLQVLDRFKNKLYTNITHEFRTPLTVISGVAAELKDNKEMFDSGVQIIQRNSSRLLNLVNQMLDLSKLQSGTLSIHFVNGDIVHYIGYIVQSFQSLAASKQIQLHFLPEFLKMTMDYDAEKTMQIMSNLISNAIKFTPSGGNVYVHMTRREDKGMEQIQFKVQDTGIGIAPHNLPHIFDRFYQIDDGYRSDKGTGVGLALVKELVQLLDGSITVQSNPDKGSVFIVTLPVTQHALNIAVEFQPDSNREVISSFVPEKTNGLIIQEDVFDLNEKPRLLIIEDTPDVIHYLRMCLDKDFRITEATDGAAGIDMAIDTIPDIIITDVMMPVKDGYEVCRTLKEDECTSHIPIIMLTARADTPSKLEGLRTGADAYLYKPFNKEELLIRLQKLLELRTRLQRHYLNGESILSVAGEGMEKEDQFIKKLKEIIHSNLDDEDFGIIELCGMMHLSRTQLHYKIKALTGRSTSLYIRLIRLQKAKEMLKNSEMHVSEVAYATGFRDPAYFTRCFVEDYGMNPSEFRKIIS